MNSQRKAGDNCVANGKIGPKESNKIVFTFIF